MQIVTSSGKNYFFDGISLIEGEDCQQSKLLGVSDQSRYSTPRTFSLTLLNDCNLRCKYCYASQGAWDGRGQKMSLETAFQSVDLLASTMRMNRDSLLSLSFFGGKPLLAMSDIEQIVAYTEEQYGSEFDLRFITISNGTLLNDKKAEFLREHNFCLSLSLDGEKERHDAHRVFEGGKGTFDAIMQKKDLLKGFSMLSARMTFAVNPLELVSNIEALYLEGFFRVVYELDYSIQKECVAEVEREVNCLADWYIQLLKAGNFLDLQNFSRVISVILLEQQMIAHCAAGRGYFSIGTDGSVYLCHRYIGSQSGKIGDVFQLSPSELDRKAQEFEKSFLRLRDLGCQ